MAPEKNSVRQMFEEIAPRYDFLNHFLSLGIDRSWRRRVVREAGLTGATNILDVATGTADLAIALTRLRETRITGIDFSPGMLEAGIRKVYRRGLGNRITLLVADGEHMPFAAGTFDAVTIAFGVRNFENIMQGLREMHRVLKPGGSLFVLEFSHPDRFPVKQLYRLYSALFIPLAGRLISRHRSAYRYLPDTIAAFPSGDAFLEIMNKAGFNRLRRISLAGGIASVYHGLK